MVRCKVCQKEFKGITPTHLRKAHEMTMAQYREKFPDAVLAVRSKEHRANYSRSSKERWADPEYKAKNAPRLAAMGAAANESLQEKRRTDPEFNEEWLASVRAAQEKNKGKTRAGVKIEPKHCACGTVIVQKATQCQPCYQASRLEKAMHPCGHPDCDALVKGHKEYCSDKCLKSNPTYIDDKRRAGRVSQKMYPENQDNLVKGGRAEALNRPDVREKQRAAASLAHKGKPKSIEQRLKMSQGVTRYWRSIGIDGTGKYNPPNWNLISEHIRLRDGQCLYPDCERTVSPCGRELDVHHLNGDRTDNSDENLIALCRPHHSRVTAEGNKWRP